MGRWNLVDEGTAETLRKKSKKTIDLLKSTVVLGFNCGPLVACNPKGSMAFKRDVGPSNTTCTDETLEGALKQEVFDKLSTYGIHANA